MKNYAFIDGQNLHLGTQEDGWTIDLYKFRRYLKDKFNVDKAFYFLWAVKDEEIELYKKLQYAGFIVLFREHSSVLLWKKKWNVDCDIVFEVLTSIIDEKDFDKIVLVSGDWDYIKLVRYLIDKWLFEKILFPNKHSSSLYKPLNSKFKMNIWDERMREKLEYKKK